MIQTESKCLCLKDVIFDIPTIQGNLKPALIKTISLRKNKEHVLVLKSGDREKRIMVYPKIGAGWLVVDLITGIFPIFVDAYTGNWNYFEEINAGF